MQSSVEDALLIKIHLLINKAYHLENIFLRSRFPESLLTVFGSFFNGVYMDDKRIELSIAPAKLQEEFHPHIMLTPARRVLEWIEQQILSTEGHLYNTDHISD